MMYLSLPDAGQGQRPPRLRLPVPAGWRMARDTAQLTPMQILAKINHSAHSVDRHPTGSQTPGVSLSFQGASA